MIMVKCTCRCKDTYFGDGKNRTQKTIHSKKYTLDNCIINVLEYLWGMNINTLNSCCGHNILYPTVIVDEYSILKMFKLGYKSYINNNSVLVFKV